MKRIILFDFGDTLVGYYRLADFPPILATGIRNAGDYLAGLGLPTVEDDLVRQRTQAENFESPDGQVRPLERRLAAIFGIAPGALTPRQELELCRAFLRPIFAIASPYPDALPTLEALRVAGFRIGVISNTAWGSPAEPWREEVTRHGVAAHCEHVVFCRDAGWRKPARPVFEHTLRLFGCTADECIFVGDSLKNDVLGAREAGIDAVLLDRHGTAVETDAPRIVSLAELSNGFRTS